MPGIGRADAFALAQFAAETPLSVLAADAAQVQRAEPGVEMEVSRGKRHRAIYQTVSPFSTGITLLE
jgi:hypothetical protein